MRTGGKLSDTSQHSRNIRIFSIRFCLPLIRPRLGRPFESHISQTDPNTLAHFLKISNLTSDALIHIHSHTVYHTVLADEPGITGRNASKEGFVPFRMPPSSECQFTQFDVLLHVRQILLLAPKVFTGFTARKEGYMLLLIDPQSVIFTLHSPLTLQLLLSFDCSLENHLLN